MRIYQIVTPTSHTSGHGMSSDVYELPSIDPWEKDTLYPLFFSEKRAKEYLKELHGEFTHGYKIIEMSVI